MTEVGVRIKAIADVSDAASKFGALSNSIAASRQSFNTPDSQLSLRNQFLRDSGLGGYSRVNEINQRFGTILNSIGSSDKALNKSIQSGDLESVKNYAELHKNLRNQFLKDTQLAGYKDVKLDSKPLENAIVNLTAIINQMIADGKSKEAKEYGSILKGLQGQLNSENNDEQRERLQRDQQTRFFRGLNKFFGIGQNAIGQAGAGNAAGAALSAAGGAADIIGMIPKPFLIAGGVATAVTALMLAANKLSEQWEKMMQPSMGLAASLGELGSDAKKNSAAFKEVFSRATASNVLHGYKLEEGLQLANELSKMGVRSDNVFRAESQVFGYQRATDADRGLLSRAVGLSERYRGGENILGYAYGGLKESGMQSGQYQEYLNATLRIFEEGLSKGVVKGFAEITRTQNMLAQIGETWKGEAGMERRQNISSAIEGSYNLQSDHDVMIYRAAQAMTGSNDYETIAMALDEGIDAKGKDGKSILTHYRDVLENTTGLGQAGIMTTMKSFNLNYTSAKELLEAVGKEDFGAAKAILEDPKSKGVQTTEEKLLSKSEEIRAAVATAGSYFLEGKTEAVSGLSAILNFLAGDRSYATAIANMNDDLAHTGISGELYRNFSNVIGQAYKNKSQPLGESGLGLWGENATKVQLGGTALPEGSEYYLRSHPDNPVFTALKKFKKGSDFGNKGYVDEALQAYETVGKEIGNRTPDDLRREYFEGVAGSITGNTKEANTLRNFFSNPETHGLITPGIMNALDNAMGDKATPGKISAYSPYGYNVSEVMLLIQTLNAVAKQDMEVATELKKATMAMEKSSEINVVVEK